MSVSKGAPKELKVLIERAKAQGWEVTKNNGNHLRWKSPTGASVFTAGTPSDWRAIKNIMRDLRKYGFAERK